MSDPLDHSSNNNNSNNNQRQRENNKSRASSSWKDLPSFCDVSASVAVTAFAARRLPEIKDMWAASTILRNSNSSSNSNDTGVASNEAAIAAASIPVVSVRSLQSGGCKTSSRHLRRRATSHKIRYRKRFRSLPAAPPSEDAADDDDKNKRIKTDVPSSRRARRHNRTILNHPHHAPWQFPLPPDYVRGHTKETVRYWIPTHLWHAKRFHMIPVADWQVPALHTNRGAQAALRLCHEKCVLQDVTWCRQPIWLVGPRSVAGQQEAHVQKFIPTFTIPKDWLTSVDECRQTKQKQQDMENNMVVFGEGLLHRAGIFPNGATAPVSWMITLKPWEHLQSSTYHLSDYTETWKAVDLIHIYLMVHPWVFERSMVHHDLQKVFTIEGGPLRQYVHGGLACFKLRGSASEACLKNGVMSCSAIHVEPSCLEDMDNYLDALQGEAGSMAQHHLSAFVIQCRTANDRKRIFLVRQAPRDVSLRENVGVSGYDIYCCPQIANDLFFSFNIKGGACPIGLAEEAHLCLEAEPPVPFFPRDYTDTPYGQVYWKSSDEGRCPSTTTLRAYLESGTGRVQMSAADKRRSINWTNFVGSADEDGRVIEWTDESLAIVRGSFVTPFRDALLGTAGPLLSQVVVTATDGTRQQKRRRPQRQPSTPVKAPPLGQDALDQMQESCKALLRHLALPALLVCHIQVYGKGRLQAGHIIRSIHDSDDEISRDLAMLGLVTAGCFSPSRGRYHGIGVIGAARFLQAVAQTDRSCPPLVVRKTYEMSELQLSVRIFCVKFNHDVCIGTISLIV